MTTTTGGRSGPIHRFAIWLSHYQVPLLIVIAALYSATYFLWWLTIPWLALVALFGMATMGAIDHLDEICLRCGNDFPLNAPELARGKHRRTLRTFHFLVGHIRWLPWLALALGVSLVVSVIVGWWWFGSVVWLATACLVRTSLWHQRLRPCCPYCRDNGGGAPPSDVPPPTATGRGDPADGRRTHC